MGRGCVKTSIESQFVPRLRNFKNLQFAKALISLSLKFQLLRQNHNSNSSSAFSHSLGQQETFWHMRNCGDLTRSKSFLSISFSVLYSHNVMFRKNGSGHVHGADLAVLPEHEKEARAA